MRFAIDACCGCHMGNIRKNNEDNFFFDQKYLNTDNTGLEIPLTLNTSVKTGLCLAVFDGMGGEDFGEVASCSAAEALQQTPYKFLDFFIPKEQYLTRLTMQLNDAVVKAKRELDTDRMGTTMVALFFTAKEAYICNIGDSRAYLLRGETLQQVSVDHVRKQSDASRRKAPLTQHLGIDPMDMQIEPSIARHALQAGDQYLLCSDGLTDMLTDSQITDILTSCQDSKTCVQNMLQAALDHGGQDNITVIVCKIME